VPFFSCEMKSIFGYPSCLGNATAKASTIDEHQWLKVFLSQHQNFGAFNLGKINPAIMGNRFGWLKDSQNSFPILIKELRRWKNFSVIVWKRNLEWLFSRVVPIDIGILNYLVRSACHITVGRFSQMAKYKVIQFWFVGDLL